MRFSTMLLLAWVMSAAPLLAATRVDLVLDEVQARGVPWPITTGVPLPRGLVASAEQCRLIDDAGAEQPLQAKVAATWDGPRGSVRWLTIDFIAQPGRKYALECGGDVRARRGDTMLRVLRDGEVRVDTGAISVDFPRDGDCPRNLRVGAVTALDGIAETYVDHRGARANGRQRQVVVEATGPVRACVRVDGQYTPEQGKPLVDYRTRYHFYAGIGLVKVAHEIRFTGSTRDMRWQAFDFTLGLRLDPQTWQAAVDGSGAAGNQVVTVKPSADTRQVSSYQATCRHYGNPECRGAVTQTHAQREVELQPAEQVGEWMQMRDGRVAVTGSMRWFWQQFPVEWQASPERMALRLWSPRGGELDFGAEGIRKFFGPAGHKYLLDWQGVRAPRTPIERFFYFAGRAALERGDADGLGINKHHEFYLHFAPAADADKGQEYGRLVAQPPLALATGAWNAASDVMGPIAARPNKHPAEAIVDRLFDLSRYAQDAFGDYGWWLYGAGPHYSYQWDASTGKHYADPRRFEYHTYQRETQHWWNYLRSGERKFLDWALPAENHWVDIAVAHQPAKFYSEYRGGERASATLDWPRGDWAIDSTMHYVRHHDTGEAWLRGQSQFWATYHRTLETTTLAYYLTGDERFNDVVEYWRRYYGDLAGKTSDSKDFQPWHRQQAWYRPTPAGDKAKTWAEMIRDYAPFNSGSRHQLTLFFNLATLYEHTWDPKIGQAVREYADAFLDPDHPLGVWRSQDNRAPIRAEAPIMAHYWVPALWRYARATGDPRMPRVLERYFKACLGADPFEGDVGVYSNCQIGYAYAFSKDPRHLRAAAADLEQLMPFAAPLARPEDLGPRLYNPYAPIRSFTAVPRLVAALQQAERAGVKIPPPALLHPQRTPLAWRKAPDGETHITLWGFNAKLDVRGPDGAPARGLAIETTRHVSAIQPWDRNLPDFAVHEHRLTLPRSADAGWYQLLPTLEMAVIDIDGGEAGWCHADRPIALHTGRRWHWQVPPGLTSLQIDTGAPKNLRLSREDGQPLAIKTRPGGFSMALQPADAGAVLRLENTSSTILWCRLRDLPPAQAWVATDATRLRSLPPAPPASGPAIGPPAERFVQGRFGQAVAVTPALPLSLPDHRKVDDAVRRFFDLRQGTLELWIKTLWDARLQPVGNLKFLTNGLIDVAVPWKLPYGEWAHVALVWRPLKEDPKTTVLHVYVDGHDHANYRSTHWEGYSSRPLSLPSAGKWLQAFVGKAPPGTAFALDELRLSARPRYVDLDVTFGGQQTVNPYRFTPPAAPFVADADTLMLHHFDGDLQGAQRR